MPVQYWESVVNAGSPYQSTTGSTYASSNTLTDVSPAPQITLPANYYYVGQLFRMTAWGIFSSSSGPNLTIGFYYGGVAGVALCATAATTTSNPTNGMWHAEATTRITGLGASGSGGSCVSFGLCHGIASTASTPVFMPTTSSSGNSVNISTNAANAWTCGALWGTNSSSNTLTCYFFSLEQLT
jgi:hypothetical protein